jgi:hypothetical protein
MEAKELTKLLQQKRSLSLQQKKELPPALASEQDGILFSDEMTDDEIRMLISQDMSNLAMQGAGTAWMSPGAILASSTDQMTASGFKALINQNNIMIRQNELIIRGLKKLAGKADESHH